MVSVTVGNLEPAVGQIAEARRKPEPQQVAEPEYVLGRAAGDGMNAARAKGSRPGRPPLNPEKLEASLLLVKGGCHQGRPPNRARTLNALPQNPSAGSCLSP